MTAATLELREQSDALHQHQRANALQPLRIAASRSQHTITPTTVGSPDTSWCSRSQPGPAKRRADPLAAVHALPLARGDAAVVIALDELPGVPGGGAHLGRADAVAVERSAAPWVVLASTPIEQLTRTRGRWSFVPAAAMWSTVADASAACSRPGRGERRSRAASPSRTGIRSVPRGRGYWRSRWRLAKFKSGEHFGTARRCGTGALERSGIDALDCLRSINGSATVPRLLCWGGGRGSQGWFLSSRLTWSSNR